MNFVKRQWLVKRRLLQSAREVHARTGKSVLAQLGEIVRLRLGPGELRSVDYYVYGVYDDERFSRDKKREVLSWHPSRLAAALNDSDWRALCRDKLLFYGLMRGLGFPFPPIYAAFDGGGRTFGSVPVFSSPAAMAAYLRDGMRYPFFAKPVRGSYGKGSSAVAARDRERDSLCLADGNEVGVDEYVHQYVLAAQSYLFQEPLRQDPIIDRITGGAVATLRMIVLRGDDGPRLFRAVWRIPVGGNITDNWRHGSQGNLVAHVDRDSGRVGTVLRTTSYVGEAPGVRRHLGSELDTHPDTGERMTGITLPGWERVVAVCLAAAAAMPGLRYQSWDIALGADGPQILELNFRGGLDITQIPGTGGFFDPEFREFWARYARDRSTR
jgi:glutathione synthase/RimK-type ligase-like ATP-grasp enzyme